MIDVAIWGAGSNGRLLMKKNSLYFRVICYLDIDVNLHGKKIEGIDIYRPEDFFSKYNTKDIRIIVSVKDHWAGLDIIRQIKRLGEANKIGVIQDAVDWDSIIWIDIDSVMYLPYLETNIVDRCNLNCKGCSHFSNLYDINTNEVDLESFEKDIEVVSTHAFVKIFRIMGGEPLLANNLKEICEISRKYLNYSDIRITTNGLLLLKKDDDFFDVLRKYNIKLDISYYPPLRQSVEKIRELLHIKKIRFTISQPIECFYKIFRAEKGDADRIFNSCQMRYCNFLRNGKVYRCAVEGLIEKYINTFGLDERFDKLEKLGISIDDISDKWMEQFPLELPSQVCQYCSEYNRELIEWEICKSPKADDWIATI